MFRDKTELYLTFFNKTMLSCSLWLSMALSGPLWLSLAPPGSLRLSLALYCSSNLLTKSLLGSQDPCSARSSATWLSTGLVFGNTNGREDHFHFLIAIEIKNHPIPIFRVSQTDDDGSKKLEQLSPSLKNLHLVSWKRVTGLLVLVWNQNFGNFCEHLMVNSIYIKWKYNAGRNMRERICICDLFIFCGFI